MPPEAAILMAPDPALDQPSGVPADRLITALGLLDPGSRALLDLSVRWGVDDQRVADLLRTEAREIARRRAAVMEQVAGHLEVDPLEGLGRLRAELAELPAEAWRVPAPAIARKTVQPDVEPAPAGAMVERMPARRPSVSVVQVKQAGSELVHAPAAKRLPARATVTAPPPKRRMVTLALGAVIGAVLGRRFRR